MQLRQSQLCIQEGNAALGGPDFVTPGTADLANTREHHAFQGRPGKGVACNSMRLSPPPLCMPLHCCSMW